MATIISIRNLVKIYAQHKVESRALRGLSFDIKESEFVAIMGPSGSGKSTLLHILGFLDKATAGEYFFEGKPATDYSEKDLATLRNKKIGFVFQDFNLLPHTSVIENVYLPLIYNQDIPARKYETMARDALSSAGLYERVFQNSPSQLSGGEQQRVAIARAIVNNPTVILADEPTGNLDSESGALVMDTLSRLNKNGRTIVLITHETYTADFAERIFRLRDGALQSVETLDRDHRKVRFSK